ncbi:MAG: DNA cytosine methyltransferase [Solimonas sp.]
MSDGSQGLAPPPARFKKKPKKVADLFCGASGMGNGAKRAMVELGHDMELVGINHWEPAIRTSQLNHPGDTFLCADLHHKSPRDAVPWGYLDLLLAAPSCTYHSRARGGRPVYDQQRTDPWIVVRWCTELRVKRLLVENVPEFMKWGPCDSRTGKPIKSREGEYFRAWIAALQGCGFKLDYKIVCCADYGDATTRERFILIGCSDGKPLRRPAATHSEIGGPNLFGETLPWRSAAEIIDWSDLGTSLFSRKKPLVYKTVSRLLTGAKREHWPRQHVDALQALIDGAPPRLDVTHDEAQEIAQRFGTPLVMASASCGAARGAYAPIPTLTGGASQHLASPLLMGINGSAVAHPTRRPAPTITTGGGSALKRPGNARPQLVTPLLAPYYGGGSGLTAQSTDNAVPAITTKARFGLATPFIITITHAGPRPHHPIRKPLKTITGANRGEFALAQPAIDGFRIDVMYRMLRNRELARATSFDDEGIEYQFFGNATEITKQIGNAVPNRTVKAHVRALMGV